VIYVFEITTVKNTPATAKKKTILPLCRGTTYKLDILFPPGPCALLHLQVCDSLHQVWPTNTGADFVSDDETITFPDEFPLDQPPYELYAYTWNEDDTYDHKLWIRIGIKAAEAVPVIPPVGEEIEQTPPF
jgi:hypothetical protein